MRIKYCNSILSKFIGLRFSKKLSKDEALLMINNKEGIFNSCVDMLFVFFPIEVFWLDKNKVIIDKARLRPFSLIKFPKKPAKYILETLPSSIKTTIGSKINF
mgnify:CR=1 FL=1